MKNKILQMIVLIILNVCVLYGCSSKEEEQCKDVVTAFLTAYQLRDESCGKYLSLNNEDETVDFEGFQSILAESLEFKIVSVELSDDYNIVNVIISNVDFGKVVDELVNNEADNLASDDILRELEKKLQVQDAPLREFEVPVKLNEEQKIEMTSELSNALLGGYTQYIYELTEGDM